MGSGGKGLSSSIAPKWALRTVSALSAQPWTFRFSFSVMSVTFCKRPVFLFTFYFLEMHLSQNCLQHS